MVPAVRDNVSSSMASVSPKLTHEGFVSTTAIQNTDNYSDANPPVPDPATSNRSKSSHRDSDRPNPEGFPDRLRTRLGETVPGLLMTPDGSGGRPELRSTSMISGAHGSENHYEFMPRYNVDFIDTKMHNSKSVLNLVSDATCGCVDGLEHVQGSCLPDCMRIGGMKSITVSFDPGIQCIFRQLHQSQLLVSEFVLGICKLIYLGSCMVDSVNYLAANAAKDYYCVNNSKLLVDRYFHICLLPIALVPCKINLMCLYLKIGCCVMKCFPSSYVEVRELTARIAQKSTNDETVGIVTLVDTTLVSVMPLPYTFTRVDGMSVPLSNGCPVPIIRSLHFQWEPGPLAYSFLSYKNVYLLAGVHGGVMLDLPNESAHVTKCLIFSCILDPVTLWSAADKESVFPTTVRWLKCVALLRLKGLNVWHYSATMCLCFWEDLLVTDIGLLLLEWNQADTVWRTLLDSCGLRSNTKPVSTIYVPLGRRYSIAVSFSLQLEFISPMCCTCSLSSMEIYELELLVITEAKAGVMIDCHNVELLKTIVAKFTCARHYSFHWEPRKWELQCLIDKIGRHSNNVGMKSGNELPYSSELQSTGNTNSMGKHQSTTVSSVLFYAVGKLVHALLGRYLYRVIKTLFVVIGPPYGSPIMIQLLFGDIRQQQFCSRQTNGCGYGLTGSCHLSVYGARYAKFRIGMVHSLAKVLSDVIMSKAKVIDISATCGQLAPNQTSSQPAFDQLAIHFNYVVMLPCGERWALYELYMHIHRVRSGMCFDPGGHSPFFGVTFAFLAFTMRYGLKYFTAFDAQVLSTDSSGTIHGKFLTANLHKVERNDFLISAVHLNTYVVTCAAAILDVFLETGCLMFLSWPLLMVGAMWLQTSHVLHPTQHRQLRNCNDSLNVCCYSAAVLFENAYLGSIVIGKVLECFGVASTLSWLWVHCSNGGRTQSRMLYSSQCGLTVYNARCMKAQCGVSHIPWHIFDIWPHYVKGTGYLQSTTPFFWQVSVQGVNYRPLTFKLLSDSINLCPRNTVLTVREYHSVQEMSQGSPKCPPIAVPMRINCQFQVLRGVVLVMSAHVYGHCSWLSNIGDSVDQSMRVQSSNTAIPVRYSIIFVVPLSIRLVKLHPPEYYCVWAAECIPNCLFCTTGSPLTPWPVAFRSFEPWGHVSF